MYSGAIIFLHGSGDTGGVFRQWLSEICDGQFWEKLIEHKIKVVCPTAPLRKYSLAGGSECNVWHDREELALDSKEDVKGIEESMKQINRIISSLVTDDKIPIQKIVLGGFSMGGSMTLQYAFRQSQNSTFAQQLGGLFVLSSFLSSRSPIFETLKTRTEKKDASYPSLYYTHGEDDDLIPFEWGRITCERLRASGVNVKFEAIPDLMHALSDDEIIKLTDIILDMLRLKKKEKQVETTQGTKEEEDKEKEKAS